VDVKEVGTGLQHSSVLRQMDWLVQFLDDTLFSLASINFISWFIKRLWD
jgi:hypothetical protein